MTLVIHRFILCGLMLSLTLCSIARSVESVDPLKQLVTDALSIELKMAISQKRFSIMSRGMADPERCAARELLGASFVFFDLTEQVLMVGKIVGEMKSGEDETTARKHLAIAAHHAMGIGETDLKIVDEYLAKITTPEAVEEAKIIRGQMIELRGLFKPFASDKS